MIVVRIQPGGCFAEAMMPKEGAQQADKLCLLSVLVTLSSSLKGTGSGHIYIYMPRASISR